MINFRLNCALTASLFVLSGTTLRAMTSALLSDLFESELIVKRLGTPTDFEWTPQGDLLLVTDKIGNLWLLNDVDGDYTWSAEPAVALNLTDSLCTNSERGLQGVEVHPQFGNLNRWIYLYYTFNKNNNCDEDPFVGPVNRFARYTLQEDGQVDVESEKVFFDTPSLEYDHHNSGDIAFGKDGMIYVTIGDGGSTFSKVSQDLGNLFGTIVRLTDEGDIPPDNPFTFESGEFESVSCRQEGKLPPSAAKNAKCAEIFAYGLRNPFRFAMDPNYESGVRFYINDVGQSDWEEVNEGGADWAAANYGWPIREGPCQTSLEENCDDDHSFVDPIHYYIHDSEGGGAVTGGAFVPNGVWSQELDGSYVYADYVFDEIYLLPPGDLSQECRACNPPADNRTLQVVANFTEVLTIKFGPDNNLYLSTKGGGKIYRIHYVGDGNRSPEAVILANPTEGPAGTVVSFSAAGSSDYENQTLLFSWDFDGDGISDSMKAVDSFAYDTPGLYRVGLTVLDSEGASRTTFLEISIGSKPVPVIDFPIEGTTFAVGDVITLVGSATDAEDDATSTPLELSWEVRQHHNTHYHPFLDAATGNNIKLQPAPPPEDYEAATSSYLEILLTATDSHGLSSTVTRDILPRTREIEMDTVPSGLEIIVDGSVLQTPGAATSWEGHSLRVEVVDQGGDGFSYVFESWSDGGDQLHEFTILPSTESMDILVAAFVTIDGTFEPTSSPTATPRCLPRPLLVKEVDLLQGEFILYEDDDGETIFIMQQSDGILLVAHGSPSKVGELIWASTTEPGEEGSYYTRLAGDGNLSTRRGTPENKDSTFWKAESAQIVSGDYFLGLGCRDEVLSVFQGTPKNPGNRVWNAVDTRSPSSSPTTADNNEPVEPTETPSESPEIDPTNRPVDPPTDSPSDPPTAMESTTDSSTGQPASALTTESPSVALIHEDVGQSKTEPPSSTFALSVSLSGALILALWCI